MKYIVYRDGDKDHLITFPNCINHNRMADAMEALRFGDDRDWHRRQGEVVSAGFIDGGECHGRSESLDIDSRKGIDTMILRAGGSAPATEQKA
jgi:hypothetical protein